MIDVSYAAGGALGCTFFPEAVDVSAQFNGSALDRDADLRSAGAEFPADLILDIMLQFCVTPHGLALGPHGTDRRFSSRVYQSLQRGVLPQDQNENRSESRMRAAGSSSRDERAQCRVHLIAVDVKALRFSVTS
jgi:hypothetical protein